MSYDIDIAEDTFNYTWNLSRFFHDFGVHPYADLKDEQTEIVAVKIEGALEKIERFDLQTLRYGYDPANKWGSVEGAVEWLKRIHASCLAHPGALVQAS